MKLTGEAKLFIALGALVLGGVGFLMASTPRISPPPTPAPVATPAPITAALVDEMYGKARHTKGDANAAITIVEFADLECPSCRQAYRDSIKGIEKKMPVRFAFYHLPLPDIHPRAIPAAAALEAAAKQGKFWEMYDELFADKSEPLTDEIFANAAKAVGLDAARFEADRTAEATTALVNADQSHAVEHGINTTPTFLVKDKNGGVTSVSGAAAFGELVKDLQDGVITPKPAAPAPPAIPTS